MKLLFIAFLIYFHGALSQTIIVNNQSSYDGDKSKLAAIRKIVCNSNTNTNGHKGEKGEPGDDFDAIDRIEMLDRENKFLSQQLSMMKDTVNKIVTIINETSFDYTVKITPYKGNFDECRKQCQAMGGDLIHKTFGEDGIKYHSQLRKMVEASGKQVWVGITDRQTEGVFRYLNGEIVNVIKDASFLYYFKAGEPNNSQGREECVHVLTKYFELNDMDCTKVNYYGADFHGLCEIKNFIF